MVKMFGCTCLMLLVVFALLCQPVGALEVLSDQEMQATQGSMGATVLGFCEPVYPDMCDGITNCTMTGQYQSWFKVEVGYRWGSYLGPMGVCNTDEQRYVCSENYWYSCRPTYLYSDSACTQLISIEDPHVYWVCVPAW